MSNMEVSDLTAATLPLTGTELVPVIQGGVSKNVAAANVGKLQAPDFWTIYGHSYFQYASLSPR